MIKAGSTYNLLIKLNITRPFDSVIFTLQSGSDEQLQITKKPTDYTEGVFILGLTQQQTQQLSGTAKIEAQINYSDKSVDKSNILYKVISPTLATTLIEGNAPSDDATMEDIDLVLQVIKGDVAILIGPDSSKELIVAITQLFEQTKAIADDVQERADNGEFDGRDGKSAYEIATDEGYEGTEAQWIASLKGEPGKPGEPGEKGEPGKPGADGKPGAVPLYNAKNEYVEFVSENDYEKITEAKIEELINDYVGGGVND